jgi:hypothetical protein
LSILIRLTLPSVDPELKGRLSPAHVKVLELARTTGEARRETIALNNLGALAHDRGAYGEAIDFHAAALQRKRELGDCRGVAVAQLNLGAVGPARREDAVATGRQTLDQVRRVGPDHR